MVSFSSFTNILERFIKGTEVITSQKIRIIPNYFHDSLFNNRGAYNFLSLREIIGKLMYII